MSGRRRRLLCLLVTLGVILAGSSFAATVPAHADCFAGEQTIFVGNYGVTNAYGSTNTIDIRNRDLATSCGTTSTWSTSQLGSSTHVQQVEVGWKEYMSGGSKHWCIFWAAQNGGAYWQANRNCQYETSTTQDVRFRVEYDGPTDKFYFWVDNGNGFTCVCVEGDSSAVSTRTSWDLLTDGPRARLAGVEAQVRGLTMITPLSISRRPPMAAGTSGTTTVPRMVIRTP
jgi:hypothetical protein